MEVTPQGACSRQIFAGSCRLFAAAAISDTQYWAIAKIDLVEVGPHSTLGYDYISMPVVRGQLVRRNVPRQTRRGVAPQPSEVATGGGGPQHLETVPEPLEIGAAMRGGRVDDGDLSAEPPPRQVVRNHGP